MSSRRERIFDEASAANWIENGMTIAVGQPTPMALLRQLIRRGIRDLTVVDAGFSLDLLIAAGCVRKVISYYAGGGFGNPVTPAFRHAAERGEIEVWSARKASFARACRRRRNRCPSYPGGAGSAPRYRR